ncbi:uncharacterized protein HD556DRAFT_1313889 [Suillus plorans]|uniref:Uncharacterized protein n=1 Tax=Suillus plorans TaxID=116603 RepID=A0A9P7AD26_9AGAM|nr:uncharacterized protein HD556DRAFT_1313889 [Suillus plorans]KAG1785915.1 hypothetical protein HD556DRAFT_1313889 [Suillus plorans]KAG1822313.1 hypothetical protein EV424DRAFT_1399059 [Suillus variegatus]
MYQFFKKIAKQCVNHFCTISKHLGNAFKNLFPPPSEAPGHEKRMDKMNTTLDRVEECFLRVFSKLGASRKFLQSLTGPLKTGVKYVVVTIGDIIEQHPYLVTILLCIAIGMLLSQCLPVILGFGPLGPVKGGIAAWLQGWVFGGAVPAGSWFAILQRFAMVWRAWL